MSLVRATELPEKEVDQDIELKLPHVERDFQLAKRYLQKYGGENENVWGHLVEVIHKIMLTKKEITPKELHNLCRRLRERKLQIEDWMRDIYEERLYLSRSIELIELYIKPKYKWNWEERNPDTNKLTDEKFMAKMRMTKSGGCCLPQKEIFAVMMAMRVLADNIVVTSIVFWGKIFGVLRDYYIVECEIDPAELERMRLEEEEKINQQKMKEEEERLEKERIEKEEQEKLAKEEAIKKEREKREKIREKRREKERKRQEKVERQEKLKQKRIEMAKKMGLPVGEVGEGRFKMLGEGGEGMKKKKEEPPVEEPKVELPKEPESLFNKYVMPKLPEPKPKVTYEVPAEPYGTGLNKREYYVCNLPGEPWIKLPDVTPKQISTSRRITKFLTGDLEADVISMPPFPGKEKNYLRAMIARISACTQVSPVGYYTGGGEEGGFGEGGGEGGEATLNTEFNGMAWQKLIDSNQIYWAHHSPYILPQGRLKWWRPPRTEEEGAGGEGQEAGEGTEIKPERGPPILRTIVRDTSDDVKPWSVRASSIVLRKGVAVSALSNLWPGAGSIAFEFNYQYIYVGWGTKFSQYGYTPPYLPKPQVEYEIGPEILEVLDPTPEEEEAWRIAHMPKEPKKGLPGEGGEGGGPGEGEAGEEDEDEE